MKRFDQKRLDKIKAQYAQTRPNLTLELITEVERLRVIESKWTELLPNLEILRHYLFRVDHKLASLGEMIETPAEIVDYTSAFLSVLEVYFPSTEEEELAASELTRLERLGLELSQTGGELKEEVKREFASLKAQVDTQITRLEAEVERLQADSRALAALRPVAQGIIEQVDNGGEQIPDSWGTPIYEVALNLEEVEALRDGLAESEGA